MKKLNNKVEVPLWVKRGGRKSLTLLPSLFKESTWR